MSRTLLVAAALAVSLPALAQTTTVTSQQQATPLPPPPPPSSTTVTTQSAPPPTTQVVVNPNDPNAAPPPRTRVRVDSEATSVETTPTGRSSIAIIAVDSLYGGIAGALVGGGVTLIDQGNHWQRDIMVGAGIGVLAGAAFGVYEIATSQPSLVRRAAADSDPAASSGGTQLAALGGRF